MMKIRFTLLMFLCLFLVSNVVAQQLHQQQPQRVTVEGAVFEKDGLGESLPNVTIQGIDPKTKKQLAQALSDEKGNFKITIPVGAELHFSYISFNPFIYQVKGAASGVKILMEEHWNDLDDVIIVGYQEKSRADVTSAVTRINAEVLAETPVSNVMDLLQGRVPGMDIQLNNGLPGAQGRITIRGVSDISLVGNETDGFDLAPSNPLFVVDGIPQPDIEDYDANGLVTGSGVSPISSIAFEDIDNIQILKDAAATSLYGADGAYGVILIETKRGNSPTPQITYSSNFTVSLPPSLRQVAVGNAERYLRMRQILENDTSRYHGYNEIMFMPSISDSLNPYWNNNTDWQGEFYRVTYNQSHNLSFLGGSDAFNYKLNGNYYTEKGIVKNTDFDRYSLNSILGFKPNSKFNIDVNFNLGFTTNSTGSGNAVSQSGVAKGASASSLLPPPSLYSASMEALQAFSNKNENTAANYSATVNMGYLLPYDIRWSGTFNYSYNTSEREDFIPAILAGNNYMTIANNVSNHNSRLYARSTAFRSFDLKYIRLSLNAGFEYRSSQKTGNTVKFTGLPSDYILGPVGHGISEGTVSASDNLTTFSLIFSPNFGIKTSERIGVGGDKYVFSPSLRPEMSSVYGQKTKWNINPALGFRWNVWQEPFMQKFDKISNLSFRASWGRVVKYKASRYDVWGNYDINPDNMYDGELYIPISYSRLPSAYLDPITSTSWNLGWDMTLFNGRLHTEVDAYYRQVDNQLRDVELPDHSGFDKMLNAETSLVNYGLEVSVAARPLPAQSKWNLYTIFNFAVNRDIITKLPNGARQILNSKASVANKLGKNTTSILHYINKGVYATDEEVPVDPATGKRLRVGNNSTEEAYFKAEDPIWVDVNGDYIIDERDRVIAGDASPRVTGGFAVNLGYKSLSVHVNTSFTLRRDIVNEVLADRFDAYGNPLRKTVESLRSGASLAPIDKYDFWTPDNRYDATYPNPFDYIHAQIIDPFRPEQTLFMEDGSYFKINTVSFAWRIPRPWIDRLGIRSASLKSSIDNIYTFSHYSGISPESVNGLGFDKSGGYPNPRRWTVGITIGL